MERKIGERFDYEGVTLKVVKAKDGSCYGCYFYVNEITCSCSVKDAIGPCAEYKRSDMQSVIFKTIKRCKHEDK